MSSRSLNKVMLIGNLTRDPELRYTPQGTAVCTFGLATNRSWVPSGGGERQEETEFHRIVAWNKLAELCAQLLFKGRKVYVEGRLQTRRWTGQDGQERTTTEVVIDNMIVLDSKRREGEATQAYADLDVPEAAMTEPVAPAAEAGAAPAAAQPAPAADDQATTAPAADDQAAQPAEESQPAEGKEEKKEEEKGKEEKKEAKKEEEKEEKEESSEEKPAEKKEEKVTPDDIPF